MAAIEPPEPRATVVREATGLRITIPVKRSLVMSLFLTVWLGLWGVGGGTALLGTLRGEKGDWLVLAFLAVWIACCGFGVYLWLWQLAGQEVVVVRPRSLILRREILGFGRSREFDLRHVRDLRVSPSPAAARDWGAGLQSWGIAIGPLAFDYGARTYRFGGGVDEAEAKDLVRWITQAT
jgi:hypothetical protein